MFGGLKGFLRVYRAVILIIMLMVIFGAVGFGYSQSVTLELVTEWNDVGSALYDAIADPQTRQFATSIMIVGLLGPIESNMDIFGVSPFDNLYRIYSDYLGVYTHRLELLPSWFFGAGIGHFLTTGGTFSAMVIGALIAAAAYNSKKLGLGLKLELDIKKACPIKLVGRQILMSFGFIAALLVFAFIVFAIAGGIYYFGARDNALVLAMNNIEGLWQPGLVYNMRVLAGAFILLASFAIFGIFLGHVFKRGMTAVLIASFIALFFWPDITAFVLPYYFTGSVLAYFMLPGSIVVNYGGGSFIFHFAILVLYLVVIAALAVGAIYLRQRFNRRDDVKE